MNFQKAGNISSSRAVGILLDKIEHKFYNRPNEITTFFILAFSHRPGNCLWAMFFLSGDCSSLFFLGRASFKRASPTPATLVAGAQPIVHQDCFQLFQPPILQ